MTAALLAEALAAFGRQEVLLLAAILLASFVLEDAAVVAAALLAAQGVIAPVPAVAILCFGTSTGDFGLHLPAACRRGSAAYVRNSAEPV